MNVFIGLDVSLASTAICAVSESGKILRALSADSEPESLVRALREIDGTIAGVGLEAGPLSQWLYKHLTDAGFETVLLETRHVKGVLKAMPIKTDRRDAEGIARLLHMGWFRPGFCRKDLDEIAFLSERRIKRLRFQITKRVCHDQIFRNALSKRCHSFRGVFLRALSRFLSGAGRNYGGTRRCG